MTGFGVPWVAPDGWPFPRIVSVRGDPAAGWVAGKDLVMGATVHTGRTVHAGRTLDLSSFETKRGLLRFGETEQEAPELTEPTPAVVDGPSAADLAPDPDPAPELHPAHAALLAAHREASEPPATVPPPTTPDGVNNPGEQKKPADAPSL